MKTLWLVRHARPLIDTDRCYGRLDVAADAKATGEAAQALRTALHAALQADLCDVHLSYSPLQRCEQLAHDLKALEANFTITPDTRLLEMDFGEWEGQRWDDIGEAAVSAWAQNLTSHAPGNGESLAQMLHRVNAALQEARSRPQSQQVWITHAGVARCVQWLLQHGETLPQSEEWALPAPAYGQWLKLNLS